MNEKKIRRMVEGVKEGRLSRRSFIQKLVAAGLTAPMASMILMHEGVAQAQTMHKYAPTKRGGGGALKILWWQGPTLLNPHFATGSKDQDGSRIFYEPLATWDEEGNMVAVLAAELPSKENGGLAADGTPAQFIARSEPFDLAFVASLQPGSQHPRELFAAYRAQHGHAPERVCVWVGPEGDFTPEEIAITRGAGAIPITLGPLVLRADTAAVYCLSVLSYELQAPG